MGDRYYARSASGRTDDWPFWFIADRNQGGLNVTAPFLRDKYNIDTNGGVFLSREEAQAVVSNYQSTNRNA